MPRLYSATITAHAADARVRLKSEAPEENPQISCSPLSFSSHHHPVANLHHCVFYVQWGHDAPTHPKDEQKKKKNMQFASLFHDIKLYAFILKTPFPTAAGQACVSQQNC